MIGVDEVDQVISDEHHARAVPEEVIDALRDDRTIDIGEGDRLIDRRPQRQERLSVPAVKRQRVPVGQLADLVERLQAVEPLLDRERGRDRAGH